ncbi:MAG: DUF547 domain-containing protein [Candidatus Limnocylindrales bacterium]
MWRTPTSGDGLVIAARFLAAARADITDDPAAGQLASLDPVLLAVELAAPSARLAFWINVYNGAVRARLLRDPVGYRHRWRFFSGPAVTVAGQVLSANSIEHGILRRSAMTLGLGYVRNPVPSRFERLHRVGRVDPRVHFALNCGARSCPPLSTYDAEHLDAQLDAAAASYLENETAVLDGGERVLVPRLLLWYLGDLGGKSGVLRLLLRYGVVDAGRSPQINFGRYDWTLAVEAPRRHDDWSDGTVSSSES